MKATVPVTGEQLAQALHDLGVNFIMEGELSPDLPNLQPMQLITALAQSPEARLRLALIPLFLEHPEFAAHVRAAALQLDPAARLTLQCYFTAAVWLGQQQQPPCTLPDHFSQELNLLPSHDPTANLQALAKCHQERSGTHVNWLGTYQHGARRWLRHAGRKI